MREGRDLGWNNGTYSLDGIKFKMFVIHSITVVQGTMKSFKAKTLQKF